MASDPYALTWPEYVCAKASPAAVAVIVQNRDLAAEMVGRMSRGRLLVLNLKDAMGHLLAAADAQTVALVAEVPTLRGRALALRAQNVLVEAPKDEATASPYWTDLVELEDLVSDLDRLLAPDFEW